MNRSFIKMTTRGIKSNLSRFLSIVGIVAIGVGFLAGLMATTPDMKSTANDYFNENNFYDFYIQSTLGFSDEDIEALKKESYVEDVLAIEQEDEMVKDSSDEILETRIFYVDLNDEDKINNFELIEGRMPEAADECLIEVPNQYSYSAEIDSIYTLEDGEEYKAVGIVKSPMFLSASGEGTQIGKGTISLGMYINQTSKPDVYTAVYGLANIDRTDTFSEQYEKDVEAVNKKLEAFAKVQAQKRYEQVKGEAQDTLDENKSTFDSEKQEALAKLEESYNTLMESEQVLADGLSQVAGGQQQIEDGLNQLDTQKSNLISQQSQLDENLTQVNTVLNQLENGISQVDDAIAKVQESLNQINALPEEAQEQMAQQKAQLEEQLSTLQSQKEQLLSQQSQLNSQKSQIVAGQKQVEEGLATIESTRANLLSKQSELKETKAQLTASQKELEEGWNEYYKAKDEAMAQLDDAEKQIDEAQAEIDDIEPCEWYTFTRLDSNGVSGFKGDVEKVGAIAEVFPVFFFLVAALVVLTTMTRMIEEERMEVGTLKSLGYSNGIILGYYLTYGLVATIIGSVIGLCGGFAIFPKVISNAYRMMYNVPEVKTEFLWNIAGYIELITVIVIMLTIFSAVKNELREKPAMLMQPKAPKAGKRIFLERITPLWKRITFSRKVTLRNLFRYKKRFLMTVIGVSGCFALLVTGFGIRNSIGDIVDKQYGEIFSYDMSISADTDKWVADETNFSKEGFFYDASIDVTSGDETEEATLNVPENQEALDNFVNLRTRKDHTSLELSDKGVIVSEKMSEVLGIKVGDYITLTSENDDVKVKVTGICENYVQNKVFMTSSLYEKLFGEAPDYNTIYTKLQNKDLSEDEVDEIVAQTMEKDGVSYVLATDTIKVNFSDSVKNIDYIVLVLIFSAGALTVIVLYNLTNINICERKKELATIKVLGFYDNEVSAYIFREIYILAAIGMIVGIPLGMLLHKFVIKMAEVGGMMFGRDIYFSSFAFSVVIILLFTILVNLIMRRSIKKIDMVESMKVND